MRACPPAPLSYWRGRGAVGIPPGLSIFWQSAGGAKSAPPAGSFTSQCSHSWPAIISLRPVLTISGRRPSAALVGVGEPGRERPAIIAEPWPGKMPRGKAARKQLLSELEQLALGNALTRSIHDFLLHPAMPVDIRHNAKIFRETLAVWAARKLR